MLRDVIHIYLSCQSMCSFSEGCRLTRFRTPSGVLVLVKAIEQQSSASLARPSSILIGNWVVILIHGELNGVFRSEENTREHFRRSALD